MPTVTMIAPFAGQQFIGLPSGNFYVADENALVQNVQSYDVTPLQNAGCRLDLSGDLITLLTSGALMSYIPTSVTYTPLVITSNTFTLGVANDLVQVNKTTGSATAIAITAMTQDKDYVFQDMKGDAATNNITLTTSLGDGKINGANSAVINVANESLTLRYNGTTTTIN